MAKPTIDPANGDAGNDTPPRTVSYSSTKPNTVLMAKSLSEIHTSAKKQEKSGIVDTTFIAAGTLLTPEVLDEHDLTDADVDKLIARGHAAYVEVYAGAVTEPTA